MELVSAAIKGEITGMVYGLIYKRGDYIVRVVGESEDCPTYCLGMAEMLKASLVERIKNR
jgi:hypothetical protein